MTNTFHYNIGVNIASWLLMSIRMGGLIGREKDVAVNSAQTLCARPGSLLSPPRMYA